MSMNVNNNSESLQGLTGRLLERAQTNPTQITLDFGGDRNQIGLPAPTAEQVAEFKSAAKTSALGSKMPTEQSLKQKGFSEEKDEIFGLTAENSPIRTFKNKNGEKVEIMTVNNGKVIMYSNEKTGVSETMRYDNDGNFKGGHLRVYDNKAKVSHVYDYEIDAQGRKVPTTYSEQKSFLVPHITRAKIQLNG